MHPQPEVLERLAVLEARLARLEARLHADAGGESSAEEAPAPVTRTGEEREEALELAIGQHWVPRIGIFVLTLGVGFLLTYPFRGLPPFVPSIAGYAIAALGFLLSARWRSALPHVASTVRGGSVALLYFATLRLVYFTDNPVLPDGPVESLLLLVVVAGTLFSAVRRRSLFLVGLSLALGYSTALVNGHDVLAPLLVLVFAALGTELARRLTWKLLTLFNAIASVLTLLLLMLNDPVLGRPMHLLPATPWLIATVLLLMSIIAAGLLFRRREEGEPPATVAVSAVNGLVSYLLLLVLTLKEPRDVIVLTHALATLVLLGLSVAFWMRERSVYSTFIYAMLGYMAMSVAILAWFPQPDYFIWLAWQSVLVVSTALWFRSRIIVGANFLIFLLILGSYLALAPSVGVVSLSFGFVALLSARILNWKKDLLALRTEQMRNAYLACALIIFPLALANGLPEGYVSLSWTIVALFYYAMSLVVKSRKYRWMALLTFGATVVRVVVVDMVHLQAAFRIVTFLAVGLVLLWLSIWYARKKTLMPTEKPQEP